MSSPTRAPKKGLRTSSAPRVPFALLVIGLMVGGLVLLLALNTASAANELRRANLAVDDQEVSADVAALRNQVADSAAPGNLASAAENLGMVPAGNPAFIVELANGQTVLRGRPEPVTDDPLDIPTGTQHVAAVPTTQATAKPTKKSSTSTKSTTKTKSTKKTKSTTKPKSTTKTGATTKPKSTSTSTTKPKSTKKPVKKSPKNAGTTSTSTTGRNR